MASSSTGREKNSPLPGANDETASPNGKREAWWKIHLFRGMANDIRRRVPYYMSDWTDAWDYRVVPATVYMYFAKRKHGAGMNPWLILSPPSSILPALAFSLDMFQKTGSSYGVNEVLLASVLGAVVFALFAAQPLVIVGVTGPITVFNYSSLSTVYDIMKPTGVNYIGFMCWIGIWSLILHWILAVTNSCNWLRWVTRFPCDIFGFYVAFIYLQKGIQVLDHIGRGQDFYLSIVAALLVFMVAYVCGELGSSSLFRHPFRVFLKDYGTPLTIIFFTGFVHFGRMREVDLEVLPTGIAFQPTSGRSWLVNFWDLSVVSSLIAQGSEFPLRKPAGFHWDIFLLGLTTGVAGILGLPFPNGLIPQAPFHTESLCVTKAVKEDDQDGSPQNGGYSFEATHVVEQRFSNLAQGLLTLGTMTGPLLVVLHLIPHGVLAGLFFIMGVQALEGNGITAKLVFLARDRALTPKASPLLQIQRRSAIWYFVLIELVGFGATFAITQSVAAVGFPVFIFALIPIRALLLPRIFSPDELSALDAPTASEFIMEGIGGSWGGGNRDSGTPTSQQSDHLLRQGHRDSVLAHPGAPRKSQEDLAELGQVGSGQSTATRRRSLDRRAQRHSDV
ncbi:hypothetical protein F66182_6800 [Fusarium sp. NRRL 66182]|nr:hypothetical protein F66182_6800 [Fusarium sp. NRRL 66182]